MSDTNTQTDTKTEAQAKPGFKTSEFWLTSLATMGGIVLASGAIAEGSSTAQIVGGLLAVLAQLGYTASRTQVKKATE